MQDELVEVKDYNGEGYCPLISSDGWRVAALRGMEALQREQIDSMERHLATEEVFILVRGRGTLLLGGRAEGIGGIQPLAMTPGALYSIQRGVWHSIILSPGAHVLIVENDDTGPHNSQKVMLTAAQRMEVRLAELG